LQYSPSWEAAACTGNNSRSGISAREIYN